MSNGPAAQPSLPHDELGELRTALIDDFVELYQPRFTTDYQSQRLVRSTEIEIMRLESTKALILAQRQEAVREFAKGLKKEFQTVAIPETDEYANGWNDCRKRVRTDLNRVIDTALQPYLEGEK